MERAPVEPQPVIPYAAFVEANRRATSAVIWGGLGVIPVVVPGLLAIHYGRSGLRNAGATGSGAARARTGIVLGILGLLWSVAFLAMIPYAVVQARRQAEFVQCASGLRTLGQMCLMYAASNNGNLPPNLASATTFGPPPVCPAVAGTPPPPNGGYVYVGVGRTLVSVRSASTTPLAYEPLSNHGGRGMNVLFADGHVECLTPAQATTFLAGIGAPAIPPPVK